MNDASMAPHARDTMCGPQTGPLGLHRLQCLLTASFSQESLYSAAVNIARASMHASMHGVSPELVKGLAHGALVTWNAILAQCSREETTGRAE
jgi:hypothetical protein